jgi:hypothetical protein
VASDVLDEAYVRLHHWGPEWGGENGLSNHGPMAVEVLSRRGFDDQVGTWLDRYVTRLEALPGPDDPITEDNWAEAMGRLSRVGDWVAFFRREVREAPWPQVLAALPRLPEQSGVIRDRFARLADLPAWTPSLTTLRAPAAPAEIPAALASLVEAGVRQYATLGYGSPVLLVHVATAPNAMGHLLPALPQALWPSSFAATWAASAAITVAYAPATPRPAPASPATPAPADLMARAAEHGDEHVIKLTDTALDAYARTADPALLTAATHCAELIDPPR